MAGLRVIELSRPGLRPVSLTVDAGHTLCLHGPSGSGKTLLLRAIADLDPSQGQIFLGDTERGGLAAHIWRSRVMYLPPESHWWADRVGPHAGDWPDELLHALGFERAVLEWEVTRLSSGERQRLSLARVLAREPRALLLDEPTANLDQENTLAVERLLGDYQARHNSPIIWVSHDPAQRARVGSTERKIIEGRLL